jgi:hypothetical protein
LEPVVLVPRINPVAVALKVSGVQTRQFPVQV